MGSRTGTAVMPMRVRNGDIFDRKEVTEFLDEYNRKANNAQLSSEQKVLVLPDFCNAPQRAFMKRLKSYVNEHWRDSDTSQQRGTRAYLEAYVRECSQTFPGILEYYTNFLVISNACILAKRLPRVDKELVFMHMEDGPREIDVGTFDIDKIYNFVRRLYCQREGIMQASFSQAKEDARRAQIAVEASRRVTPSDIRSAVKDLQSNRRHENRSTLPQGVDQEVQDLINAMAGTKISTAEVESLAKHPAVGPILCEGKNYVYFLSQVTYASASTLPESTIRPCAILSRNNRSFLTEQPRNVYTHNSAGNYQGQGKPGPSNSECNMCNKRGHYVKDCKLYRNLNKMDQPALSVKAEMFDRMDSCGRAQGNSGNRVDFRPSASKPSGQGNTVTIKQRGAGSPAPEVKLAKFQERRMFPSHDPEPLISLDYINA
ncbi:hypothetical protein EJ02DRAFT_497236 [Clathrospora elynae]|uniref:CCHC-type domain-containing protein n=1 Tax=Clathrospora elynae TaxID=706981 RepID=A0A6A5SQD3_9PLEO|nr:hypothetical protein EJ02DRAFT_497236 [Clathrospora elynae]